MRRLLLFLCTAASFAAKAQVIERGDKLFGGSLSTSFTSAHQNNLDQRTSNAGFYPSLGFAVKNNLALGFRGQFSYLRNQLVPGPAQQLQTAVSAGLGIFLKKYRPLENRFGFYLDHTLSGTHFTQTYVSEPNYSSMSFTSWGLGYQFSPGVFYRFTDRFFGEAQIGGVYATYTSAPNEAYTFAAGATFLQNFQLGVNYRFGSRSRSPEN